MVAITITDSFNDGFAQLMHIGAAVIGGVCAIAVSLAALAVVSLVLIGIVAIFQSFFENREG